MQREKRNIISKDCETIVKDIAYMMGISEEKEREKREKIIEAHH